MLFVCLWILTFCVEMNYFCRSQSVSEHIKCIVTGVQLFCVSCGRYVVTSVLWCVFEMYLFSNQ